MKVKLVPFLLVVFTAVFTIQLFLLSQPAPVTALPPRPTATAVPAPQTPGAKINLQVIGEISPDNWSIVQWQDAQGAWHNVTGWQGSLDQNNAVIWWVGEEDLGTGPFRWLLLENGKLLEKSGAFDLPQQPFQTLIITITLPTP